MFGFFNLVSVDEGEAETVLSGTSADEVTLADQEDQALLMQVISSGMPARNISLTIFIIIFFFNFT